MIDRTLPSIMPSLLGHLGLVLAVVADFYRRSSTGGSWAFLLSLVCFVLLILAGIFFVRHPRAFFFQPDLSTGNQHKRPNTIARLSSWAFVIITPVLWLLMVIELPNIIPSEIVMRLVGAYAFFAWIAATIIVSPNLFSTTRIK